MDEDVFTQECRKGGDRQPLTDTPENRRSTTVAVALKGSIDRTMKSLRAHHRAPGAAPAPDGYLTVQEAAALMRADGLRVSDQRAYDLAADGRMPSEQRGHRVYVPRAAFEQWRREQPNAPVTRRRVTRPPLMASGDTTSAQQQQQQRSQIARIGAYMMHAKHDTHQTTRAGHDAFMSRFERQVDPQGILPPKERARRAEAAKSAYFQQLAYRRNYNKSA